MTPGASSLTTHDSFGLNFMQYSPRYDIVKKHDFDKIPIALGGDFNIDLKYVRGQEFLCNTFCMKLNSNHAFQQLEIIQWSTLYSLFSLYQKSNYDKLQNFIFYSS